MCNGKEDVTMRLTQDRVQLRDYIYLHALQASVSLADPQVNLIQQTCIHQRWYVAFVDIIITVVVITYCKYS